MNAKVMKEFVEGKASVFSAQSACVILPPVHQLTEITITLPFTPQFYISAMDYAGYVTFLEAQGDLKVTTSYSANPSPFVQDTVWSGNTVSFKYAESTATAFLIFYG